MKRCFWAQSSHLEQRYHDEEWGVPLYDDQRLFEFLILEGAQAGLSWVTILKKRDGYRAAFDYFDARKIAGYSEHKVGTLLSNTQIVRNRLKVRAAISNASAFLEIQRDYGSFRSYIWKFVGGFPVQNSWQSMNLVPAATSQSKAMSKDLKRKGFKFVGPTICYAFMQAVGMVNDHVADCFRHKEVRLLGEKSA